MKRCPVCTKSLALSEFPAHKTRRDGRGVYCRECDNARSRDYYERNRERKLAYYAERNAARRAMAPLKQCALCDQPAKSPRHTYCDTCRPVRLKQREREREQGRVRPTTVELGYGVEHQKIRKRVSAVVESGAASCARCGFPIAPGEPWDLGHDDFDRSRYNGPEHVRCNRATASRKKVAAAAPSRRW